MDKDIEVSDDYLLLQEILAEYGIPVKQLAQNVGRGASTVYRYCAGEATIPSVIWRVLFKKTSDVRITQLVTGEVDCLVVELPKNKLALDHPTIKKIVEDQRQWLECQGRVLDIIADGKIDGKDRQSVMYYKKIFPRLIESLYQTYQAITGAYQKHKGKR